MLDRADDKQQTLVTITLSVGEFHQDCEQWQYGNPITEQLFTSIGVTHESIAKELSRDAEEIVYGSL